MSDFLLITPEDPAWIQMPDEDCNRMLREVLDASTIINLYNDLFNLSLYLRDGQVIPEETILTAAQLISTGNIDVPFKFWYKV